MNDIRAIAERSDLTIEETKRFEWIFHRVPHANSITITLEAHATIIEAMPVSDSRGRGGPNCSWTVHYCCTCRKELDDSSTTIRQVYRTIPGLPGHREKVFDGRQMPVLLRAALCPTCR